MSTLREIAEETGLAIGTVSRILRGKQRVADETRTRVFEVAERLQYRPNMLIRGVQTGRTQTIGVDMNLGGLTGLSFMFARALMSKPMSVRSAVGTYRSPSLTGR